MVYWTGKESNVAEILIFRKVLHFNLEAVVRLQLSNVVCQIYQHAYKTRPRLTNKGSGSYKIIRFYLDVPSLLNEADVQYPTSQGQMFAS